MDIDAYLAAPDEHFTPRVAATYDQSTHDNFEPHNIAAAVSVLAELAGAGPAVEFAIGTGRIGLPLSQTGVEVYGIDLSDPMLDQLRAKAGSDQLRLATGDMTTASVCSDASLVYLVFNTIMNLRTQQQQVACLANMANHLTAGGYALIETMVPELRSLPPGETIRPFAVTPEHLGFEEYIDFAHQLSVSHHYVIRDGKAHTVSAAFRYVWPSELDLMAQLAGLELVHRWADWDKSPFTGESPKHVSVWRKL